MWESKTGRTELKCRIYAHPPSHIEKGEVDDGEEQMFEYEKGTRIGPVIGWENTDKFTTILVHGQNPDVGLGWVNVWKIKEAGGDWGPDMGIYCAYPQSQAHDQEPDPGHVGWYNAGGRVQPRGQPRPLL